jgi:hypothetical protein
LKASVAASIPPRKCDATQLRRIKMQEVVHG